MAAKDKQYHRRKKADVSRFPFRKENYLLFASGIFFLTIGYIALAQGPWNSVWSLTVSPVLLLLGYCVLIPLAILYRPGSKESQ
ncbi:MAG TPA: hypothetical protein ENN03_07630 [bacterium]|nr:hypothetical protein [bacterium]